MRIILVATFLLIAITVPSHADYIATGPIKGQVCKGFIIEACRFVKLDAVKSKDGRLFTIKRRYSSVSEFNQRTGRCFINVKSRGGGALSGAVNLFAAEFFKQRSDGSYKKIDVEYLSFKCVSR